MPISTRLSPMSVNTPEWAAMTLSKARQSRRSSSLEAKPGIDRVISSGRSSRSALKSMPRRCMTPGRKLSITISASSISASACSRPSSVLRSIVTISLLRCKVALAGDSHMGPVGGST